MRFNRWSTYVAALMTGVIVLAPVQSAEAALKAKVSINSLSIQTGRLLVFATSTQTFSNPMTALSLTAGLKTKVSKDDPDKSESFFWVNNGGNLTVSRFTMTITLPLNANVAAFSRCDLNVFFIAANTCASGTPTTLLDPVSGTARTYVLTLPGYGFYSFQLDQNKAGTLTVSTSASLSYVSGSVSNT